MLLYCEPLEVTDTDATAISWNEIAARERGVQVVGNHIRIASAQAVLDYEATSSTSDLRSSLQLGLGYAVKNDADITLKEALVRELCNSIQDACILIAATKSDGTSRRQVAERALVTAEVSLAVELLCEILTQSDAELLLNECHQVECGIVDGHVAHGHLQAYALRSRLDLLEVKNLVVQLCNLGYLLHLNIVGGNRPYLVTFHTCHDLQLVGQTKTFVQCRDDLMDGQIDCT